jgi:hypothetical protein
MTHQITDLPVALEFRGGLPGAPTDLTQLMAVVVHDADPDVARPEGYALVMWIGSVVPNNSELLDLRISTAP